jgi:NAD(P)-dependent dehydrogenase (short-subunit alcohol dehydrogenase family)
MELGRKGITVNAIAPGAIITDMLMNIPEKYRSKILENIPIARFGTTEEVAELVDFLASEKAAYITGQTIHINGGSYL